MLPAWSRHLHLQLLCLLAGIALLAPSVSAIRCHQCNSVQDEDCSVLANNTYLKVCQDEGKASSEAFCRKMVQKVLIDGNTRVIRACGWEKSRQSCYRNDDEDHSETVCQCFEEGCNSAPRRLAALLSLTLVSALLTRL